MSSYGDVTLLGVLHSVGEQVYNDLLKPFIVGKDCLRELLVNGNFEFYPFCLGLELEYLPTLVEKS